MQTTQWEMSRKKHLSPVFFFLRFPFHGAISCLLHSHYQSWFTYSNEFHTFVLNAWPNSVITCLNTPWLGNSLELFPNNVSKTKQPPHVRGYEDSLGFWIPDTGFRIVRQWNLGFWIPIASGIPYSLSCISDSKPHDSRFHKQKFRGFRNPDFFTWVKTYKKGHVLL